MRGNLFAALACSMLFASAFAADDVDTRARALYHDLRCMVCGAQSLAESNAELAIGMRQLIHDKLAAGENEDQIKAYLTDKYGDEILMQPPLRGGTAFIWLLPLFLIIAGTAVLITLRRKQSHG